MVTVGSAFDASLAQGIVRSLADTLKLVILLPTNEAVIACGIHFGDIVF